MSTVIQLDHLVAPPPGGVKYIARCVAPTPVTPAEIANKAYVDAGDSDTLDYINTLGTGGGATPAYIANALTALRAEPQVLRQDSGNFTAVFTIGVSSQVSQNYHYVKVGNLVYLRVGALDATAAGGLDSISTEAGTVPEIVRPIGTSAKFAFDIPITIATVNNPVARLVFGVDGTVTLESWNVLFGENPVRAFSAGAIIHCPGYNTVYSIQAIE